MRILVISETPTHPTTAGNRTYLRAICDTLKDQGHEVEFLHVVTYSRDPKYRWRPQRPSSNAEMARVWGDALHIYGISIHDMVVNFAAEPKQKPYRLLKRPPFGLAPMVASLVRCGKFDAVVINYWNLIASTERLSGIPRILITNEGFARKAADSESGWKTTDPLTEARAFDTAEVVLAIQDNEAEDFRARTKTPVLTTYHYSKVNPLPIADTANLLFLGSENPQNIEGLQHFVNRIFPAISSEFPELRLLIAGTICDSLSVASLPDGVILQGVIDNPADFYAQGNMCISPNLRGGGLKTKVLEALAHGRTVLASPYSLNDVPSVDSAPLIACTSPGEYVDAIRARLADPELLAREQKGAISYARAANTHFQRALESALATASPTKSADVAPS